MKVAWNLKGGGTTGFAIPQNELKVLHDVYSAIWCTESQLHYAVSIEGHTWNVSIWSNWTQLLSSWEIHSFKYSYRVCHALPKSIYRFKVAIIQCNGASSNLTVLKMLTGHGRTQFPVTEVADSLHDKYFLDVSFPNPEDSTGRPIFLMIFSSGCWIIICYIIISLLSCMYSCSRQYAKKN